MAPGPVSHPYEGDLEFCVYVPVCVDGCVSVAENTQQAPWKQIISWENKILNNNAPRTAVLFVCKLVKVSEQQRPFYQNKRLT